MGAIANIGENGQLDISEKSQIGSEKKLGSQLNKDDFLLLLVTQMQYQDPLEPTDNTEYVSQLAQFSELEQMENLNTTTTNSTAYCLVGQHVKLEGETSKGVSYSKEGVVDYVAMENGKVKLSIDGGLYDFDDVVEFDSSNYILDQYRPSVESANFEYRHQDPQDLAIKVNLGSHGYSATGFAINLVDEEDESKIYSIATSGCSYTNGTLTIKKDALNNVDAGKYKVRLTFNDKESTVDEDHVTVNVFGIKPKVETASNTDTTTSMETAATKETETK